MVDPRISRTAHALEAAVITLAGERSASRISVSELADRAGVSRATVYNRYGTPLEVLVHVLRRDLDSARHEDEARRRTGSTQADEALRLATQDIADHVLRFAEIYRRALLDPADQGVYAALADHFAEYSLPFIERSAPLPVPESSHMIVAQFLSHGFVGAIKQWLLDETITRDELVEAVNACAPAWWS
ncbi:TetR/AcrR family transcriptional regulator [Streptomyces sp. AK02-01A]|uniref:TetR/AcrR family transcriptional regulator n=1 Tax=Streptomyces sp. AK02-01A TaxID=3028648 RepID=UPI0029B8ABB2|nr:TetR/AcrR family transcriptional regulator [Streptomyces sp. AK02-01A]MDX3853925.1 TetR/AcrR family transcriptional regulator [Streptomyces sp. AK02-01A]